MTEDLVIVGGGGFGRETLDVVEAINAGGPRFRILGVVDDHPSAVNLERLTARSYRHLGGIDEALENYSAVRYLIGIGSPGARARLAARLDGAGWGAATAIHPSAVLGSQTVVAEGVLICAGARVSTNVHLGRHVHLNPSVTVGHDTKIGDCTSVNPGAIISGDVRIAPGVLIGAGAIVLQGLDVGARAIVGAGACVTKPVPPETVAIGVPAVSSPRRPPADP